MKNRQEVPKLLAYSVIALIVVCLLIAIFAPSASAQKMQSGKEYHEKLQKSNSWENYQGNYRKAMLSNAKETRKQQQEKQRIEKDRAKFFARLERIKGS